MNHKNIAFRMTKKINNASNEKHDKDSQRPDKTHHQPDNVKEFRCPPV